MLSDLFYTSLADRTFVYNAENTVKYRINTMVYGVGIRDVKR